MQYAVLREAAHTASDQAHAERKIAEAYRREGQLVRAIDHLQRALNILPPGADPDEEAWAHLDLGDVQDLTGGGPRGGGGWGGGVGGMIGRRRSPITTWPTSTSTAVSSIWPSRTCSKGWPPPRA